MSPPGRSMLVRALKLRNAGWCRPAAYRSAYTFTQTENGKPAVVIGVNTDKSGESFTLTSSGEKVNEFCGGEIAKRIADFGTTVKAGGCRHLGVLHPDLGQVIAVGMGQPGQGIDAEENINLDRESVRNAAAAGVRTANQLGAKSVKLEDFGDAEAAAEGATLGNWSYDQFKAEKKPKATVLPMEESKLWTRGIQLASAQNFARYLMEAPANYLTPTQFVTEATENLSKLGVSVIGRDKSWAEEKGMGSFLSVARGSHQPPQFLEMRYNGGKGGDEPIVLVGKGVTFDTGGISIKPSAKMDKMRADMGGAATVTATLKAVAEAGMPINLVVLVPLTENMPGGSATKPGDVVTAMNGKTIQVDNTDAEGRLILADALCYADSFNPKMVLDVATLTGAIHVALGDSATGVFSTNTEVFSRLAAAGQWTGDRVWRMPLWKHYTRKMTKSPLADLNNISLAPGGGSCTAAAFLREFTQCPVWLHLDIAGVMESEGDPAYIDRGMSGRPTRTLFKFLEDSM